MLYNVTNHIYGFRYGLLLDDDDQYTATTSTMTATSTGPFSISLLNLEDFKDYSYEAFISTSSTAVYYGGRHRFYTGDLTQSFPTYKGHNRAWVLTNYDTDGTHASTTVDGKTLKLRNFGSTTTPQYESGYWLSDPWDLSSITNVENSFIEYCACARNGADVVVKAAVTTSTSTEPSAGSFTIATTTTSIPGITAGDNLYGKYLWLKIELEPNSGATSTPCLCRINLAINNVGTTTTAHNALQSLAYTYDAVGNITQVKDLSGFGGDKTVNYTYDDLYRLTNASTTVPTNGGYNETFTYDRIGNIITSPQGSYTYAETGFANPSAATQVGSDSLTYDDNGNVTAHGSDTHSWNYRDRLTKSIVGGVNTFYGYDHDNLRVTKGDGTATTTYPNIYFTKTNATTTKHIYDNNGALLATIDGNGSATTTSFAHSDHLGSVTVTTDEDGDVLSARDYMPFGSERVSTGEPLERAFIGERYDTESNLNYLQQRYYSSDKGKFFSQDPVFNLIGQNDKLKEKTEQSLQEYLRDPQQLNAYSYAKNNPLIIKDPEGEIGFLLGSLVVLGVVHTFANVAIDNYDLQTIAKYQGSVFTEADMKQAENKLIMDAAFGAISALAKPVEAVKLFLFLLTLDIVDPIRVNQQQQKNENNKNNPPPARPANWYDFPEYSQPQQPSNSQPTNQDDENDEQ